MSEAHRAGEGGGLWRRLAASKLFWPLLALAALLLFNILFTRNFARVEVRRGRLYGSMIDILDNGSVVMLLATGMTLVIATAGIDLSVGSVMAISGTVAAVLLTKAQWPVVAAMAMGVAVATACGLWNGALVARLRLQPIVATLILLVAGRGIAQLLSKGQHVRFENPTFEFIGTGALLCVPFTAFIVAFVVAVTVFVVRKTVVGLYIEAVGDNETASRLSGIRPGLVKLLVYGFSGLCAGVAGLIAASDIKEADPLRCGQYHELDAILAVVIGGTLFSGGRAYVLGSIVGALIMQTLTTTILSRGIATDQTPAVKAVVVILVCLLQAEKFRAVVRRAVARGRAPG